ncbi:DNA repair protein RadC [Alkalihalophilus pseudofirmus OF4]|uniref:DNA repair protein RadC n=1 Tax=Alkalihalophilus pseudofirmus (strain ATCC BAA-2126 / JCM 17055 / OF4) TaxID=398511 RepID=D3FYG2_ALKPO|nr:DNA repair protein RadC [Alkalihalophilus pseudofirmus OF4]
MRKYDYRKQLQLPLMDVVKEEKSQPAKRVSIVSLKMVRESSMLYKERKVTSPDDTFNLLNPKQAVHCHHPKIVRFCRLITIYLRCCFLLQSNYYV